MLDACFTGFIHIDSDWPRRTKQNVYILLFYFDIASVQPAFDMPASKLSYADFRLQQPLLSCEIFSLSNGFGFIHICYTGRDVHNKLCTFYFFTLIYIIPAFGSLLPLETKNRNKKIALIV